QPPPILDSVAVDGLEHVMRLDLAGAKLAPCPTPARRAQAFTLWIRGQDFEGQLPRAASCISSMLKADPFTTLQVVLEPNADMDPPSTRSAISRQVLESLTAVCQANPTYLDRYYALQPGRPNGAKRLIVLLPAARRAYLDQEWMEEIGSYATIVWRDDTRLAISQ